MVGLAACGGSSPARRIPPAGAAFSEPKLLRSVNGRLDVTLVAAGRVVPFGRPFQVLDGSADTPRSAWKDTVNVPAGQHVRLRVAFGDIAGRTVYHCHILDHEDLGMMGVINVD